MLREVLMKKTIQSTAFILGLAAFTQANALDGTYCPAEGDLRTVVSQNLAGLAGQQPLTLRIQSQDGQTRTWEVNNAQFYLSGSYTNRIPLQAGDPLMQTLGNIVTQSQVVMDYDMKTTAADQQQRLGLRAQDQSWCRIQFPQPGTGMNAFVFHLSAPRLSLNGDGG
jgi:hypothetical protein